MLTLLSPKLWAAVILAAVLAFAGFFIYRAGAASVRAKWDAAIIAQQQASAEVERENRRLETLRQSKVIEAQNAATKRNQVHQAAAAGARAESDGLRDDLAAADAKLSSASVEACRRYATTANTVLEELAREGAGIAAKADGHASDALMLEEAWPK